MPKKKKRKYEFRKITAVVPTKIGHIEDLVEGTKLNPDRVKVLLHQIYYTWLFDESNEKKRKTTEHEEGWVRLCSSRLQVLLTAKYKLYEQFLVEKNIIEIKLSNEGNKSAIHGKECAKYRINPSLL